MMIKLFAVEGGFERESLTDLKGCPPSVKQVGEMVIGGFYWLLRCVGPVGFCGSCEMGGSCETSRSRVSWVLWGTVDLAHC